MKLSHFFLPHPETHKKAHLISIPGLLVYIVLFFSLQVGLTWFNKINPGVLGINSSVSFEEVIALTNVERAKKGLPALRENPKLNQAAFEKGQNMFEENYWAHYSPSGKDPWGFFNKAGYKYSFAGENLARNFYNSQDVVNAWMASPTHRENILNSRYQEIGISVTHGTLLGQPTILVVQEFGRPFEALAQVPETEGVLIQASEPENLVKADFKSPLTAGIVTTKSEHLIDPYALVKTIGLGLVGLIMVLLIIDLYLIRKRAVIRLTSKHLPHLALLSVAAATLFNISPGAII